MQVYRKILNRSSIRFWVDYPATSNRLMATHTNIKFKTVFFTWSHEQNILVKSFPYLQYAGNNETGKKRTVKSARDVRRFMGHNVAPCRSSKRRYLFLEMDVPRVTVRFNFCQGGETRVAFSLKEIEDLKGTWLLFETWNKIQEHFFLRTVHCINVV